MAKVHYCAKFRGDRSNRSTLKHGGGRHLGTVKTSNCIIMPNFLEIGQIAAEIWRFFDFSRSRPLPSWIFKFFKNFTVRMAKWVELRYRAKFCTNRSTHGRDLAIFRFCKMAAASILDCQNMEILGVGRSRRPKCVTVPNSAAIGQATAEIWRFFDFQRWRLQPSWIFYFLWPPCVADADTIFLPCGFFLSSIFLFFIPRLTSAVGDWMSTILRHMVWP